MFGLFSSNAPTFPRFKCALADAVEQFNHVFQAFARNALGNEHDPCAFVCAWPFFQPGQIVQQVLNALHNRWLAGLFQNVNQAFNAQQTWPKILADTIKQKLLFFARQWVRARENKAFNAFST